MRSLALVTLLVFSASFLPPTQANPTCQTLDRVQAGVHAHTESCSDVWTYDNVYFSYYWTNVTTLTTTTAAGSLEAHVVSQHYVQTGPGYTYESYQHNYGGSAQPTENALVSGIGIGAYNNQNSYQGACYENTQTGVGSYGWTLSQNAYQAVSGGSDPHYVLPCTSSDVQQTLP